MFCSLNISHHIFTEDKYDGECDLASGFVRYYTRWAGRHKRREFNSVKGNNYKQCCKWNVTMDDRKPDLISATWRSSLGGHCELRSAKEQYLGRP